MAGAITYPVILSHSRMLYLHTRKPANFLVMTPEEFQRYLAVKKKEEFRGLSVRYATHLDSGASTIKSTFLPRDGYHKCFVAFDTNHIAFIRGGFKDTPRYTPDALASHVSVHENGDVLALGVESFPCVLKPAFVGIAEVKDMRMAQGIEDLLQGVPAEQSKVLMLALMREDGEKQVVSMSPDAMTAERGHNVCLVGYYVPGGFLVDAVVNFTTGEQAHTDGFYGWVKAGNTRRGLLESAGGLARKASQFTEEAIKKVYRVLDGQDYFLDTWGRPRTFEGRVRLTRLDESLAGHDWQEEEVIDD